MLLPSECQRKSKEVVKVDRRGPASAGSDRDGEEVAGKCGAAGEGAVVGGPAVRRGSRRHQRAADANGPEVGGGSSAGAHAIRVECDGVVVKRESVLFVGNTVVFCISK